MKKTISNLKWIPLFALILAVIAVSCKDEEDNDPVWILSTNVTTIALDMNDGDVVTATITPSTTKDGASFTETYKFTSSDPLVATVSDAGVVTAVAGGTATVVVQGQTSGTSTSVAVTVTGADPAPTFTKIAELDGSITYTWDPAEMTITAVVVYDATGETELVQGDSESDINAIDYIFEADYTNGSFNLAPARSDNFKAGVAVLVKITVDGADDPTWKNPTIHDKLAYSATISTATFEWDTATVNSGIVPSSVLVYLRNNPVNDGDPYTKGDAVDYTTVGSVVGDTIITVSGLVSNTSYWFEIVDAGGEVLADANMTIPSPITQIKAGNVESVWYGDASSAQNKYAECRRIADRVSIGQGLTYDVISSVEVKDASGTVLASIGAWSQELAIYEYSYINADAPNVIADFSTAASMTAAYVHEKIDPEDGKNGEFKHISFFDLPYSDDAYTVVVTTTEGISYEKSFNTKKKYSVRNRSAVRADDHIYDDAADINAANVTVMYHSNVANDAITFEMSDAAVATIDNTGLINFVANGISVVTVTGEGGTFSAEVAAAKTYCNNYSKFTALEVGASQDMTFWSPSGYSFASATSSDEAIATVGGDEGKTITGVAEGSAVITIVDDQGNEAKMTVTIVAATVTP